MLVGYLYDIVGGDVMFYWTYVFGFIVLYIVNEYFPTCNGHHESRESPSFNNLVAFCKTPQVAKLAITYLLWHTTFHINETILPYHLSNVGVTQSIYSVFVF